jgi:hypothetical protein
LDENVQLVGIQVAPYVGIEVINLKDLHVIFMKIFGQIFSLFAYCSRTVLYLLPTINKFVNLPP